MTRDPGAERSSTSNGQRTTYHGQSFYIPNNRLALVVSWMLRIASANSDATSVTRIFTVSGS